MKYLPIVFLILLAGCGTGNYKQIDFSNVSEDQGVIIGKIDVIYNYQPFDTTGCKFCAGSACQVLLDDGYVFLPVDKGTLTRGRLSCTNPDICCPYLDFTVKSFEVRSDTIYFGNLVFTIQDPSPNSYVAPASTTHTISIIPSVPEDYFDVQNYERRKMNGEVTGHLDDFGKAVSQDFASWATTFDADIPSSQRTPYTVYFDVSVKDDMTDALEVFRAQVKNKDVKVEKNIFNIKLKIERATIYR